MSSVLRKMEEHYQKGEYAKSLQMIERCITLNRREGLQARTPAQKEDNSNQHASIKLMEGKLRIALGELNEAVSALTEAEAKLLGTSERKYQLEGDIAYNQALIYMEKKDHLEVRNKLIESTNSYIKADNNSLAITNLLEVIDYCSKYLPATTYADYFENLSNLNRKLDDKKKRNENDAKMLFRRASWLEDMNDRDARSEYRKAIKMYDKLGRWDAVVAAQLGIARFEMYSSIKSAVKSCQEAVKYAEKADDTQRGLASLYLMLLQTMANQTDHPLYADETSISILYTSEFRLQLAGILLEYAKTIMLMSTRTVDLERAAAYAGQAFDIYNELDIKIGTSASKLLEGIIEIVSGKIKSGLSMKKLSMLNLQNAKKRGEYYNLRNSMLLFTEAIFVDNTDELFNNNSTSILEQGFILELLGFMFVKEEKERGLRLLIKAEERLTEAAKKQKEFKPFLETLSVRLDHFSH